jgi:hypothetical protein
MSREARDAKSKEIVKAIVEDFTDRRGFRQNWEQIDEEIQKEIIAEWERLVEERL